jgi:pyridoxal phosphate-dependent aminotransferase EpsN
MLDERVKARCAIFDRYVQALGDIEGIQFMPELEGSMSNRWLTTLTIDRQMLGVTPMDIINALAKENIEARPVWKPLHLQPVFNRVTYYSHQEDWSVSDELFANGICLPSGSSMTVEEQNRVIDVIIQAIKR